jgi:hypothetical protein
MTHVASAQSAQQASETSPAGLPARAHERAASDDVPAIDLPEEPRQRGLSSIEVARELGLDPSSVRRQARKLGGKLVGGEWRFELETVTRRRRLTLTSTRKNDPEVARQEGEIAALVFMALREAKALDEIVIDLKVPPERVRALFAEWMKCGALTQDALAIIHGRKQPPAPPAIIAQPVMAGPSPESNATEPLPARAPPTAPGPSLVESMRAARDARVAADDAELRAAHKRQESEASSHE